jgi:hypothetical protein
MSGEGFNVDLPAVNKYSGTLSGDKALVSEVKGLVGQSDVGDESWGIVGLFVKHRYSEMLGDLNDLLKEMDEGLQAGSDKMTACAKTYKDIEDAIAKIFNDALQGGN